MSSVEIEERRKKDREYKAWKRRQDPEHERELRRAYYARNAQSIAERNLVKRATKREHAVARTIVQRALASGALIRGECEVGGDCFGRVDAHHDDYSKPLEVRWMCKSHHMLAHSPLA